MGLQNLADLLYIINSLSQLLGGDALVKFNLSKECVDQCVTLKIFNVL